jgi:UDP-GlcNAc:undecaprenyl-phosphate GlcNAc-1-phosphate transferase
VTFPFDVYLAAVLSGGLFSALSAPLWRQWCVRTGHVDEPGQRKIHHQPIPLAGGLAVMTGIFLPIAIGGLLLWSQGRLPGLLFSPRASAHVGASVLPIEPTTAFLLRHGFDRRAIELSAILLGGLGMLLVGWLDDKHELRPLAKFGGQLLIATMVAASGVRITLFIHSLLFSYAVTMLWILTVVNAFNFMDNMNGLCTGLGAIGAWYFASIAAGDGDYLVALLAALTFGALLGFLPYNFPRARAFLGDAGSHLVGYLLAVLAILPHFYNRHHPRKWAVLIPLFVLALPLVDLIRVVLIRWRAGRPFYIGDTNHLSHRLVQQGFTPSQAVLILWLLAAALGGMVWFC